MTAITLPSPAGSWSPSRGVGWREAVGPRRPSEGAPVDIPVVGAAAGAGAGLRRPAGRLHPSVYRRRRVGALLLTAMTGLAIRALALGLTGAPAVAPPAAGPQAISVHTYRVAPGDTLWAIAHRLQPTGDVRALVDQLAGARHGQPLRAGDVITLP